MRRFIGGFVLALAICGVRAQDVPAASIVHTEDAAVTALALKMYAQARTGKVDASLMTEEMGQTFSADAVAQAKPLLDQLGEPTRVTFKSGERHTKGILWEYIAVFPTAQFHVKIFINKDGKFAGYGVSP